MIKYSETKMSSGLTPEECREIVRIAVAKYGWRYPGGSTVLPEVPKLESVTVSRARSRGISVEQYLAIERKKDSERRRKKREQKQAAKENGELNDVTS
jgi:hypothetical protein